MAHSERSVKTRKRRLSCKWRWTQRSAVPAGRPFATASSLTPPQESESQRRPVRERLPDQAARPSGISISWRRRGLQRPHTQAQCRPESPHSRTPDRWPRPKRRSPPSGLDVKPLAYWQVHRALESPDGAGACSARLHMRCAGLKPVHVTLIVGLARGFPASAEST